MFKYTHLVEACHELGIDPLVKGNNIMAESRPVHVFPDPFDFSTTDFPAEELEQVQKIGNLVYNLNSQLKFPQHFELSSEKGKREHWEHNTIQKTLLPISNTSLKYWLRKVMSKYEEKKRLVVHQGRIFEVDPAAVESMRKLNENLRKAFQESDLKQARSRQQAGKRILD